MVVGIKAIGEGYVFEIELIDLATCKEKTNVMANIMKGDVMGVLKQVKDAHTQHRDKLFLPKDWCAENHITMFTSMTLDIELADKNKIAKEYK